MYKDTGRHVFAIQDYMSRIRGGNNFFQVRAAAEPVAAPRACADIVMALDREAVSANQGALAPGGALVLDAEEYGIPALEPGWRSVPLHALARDAGGSIYVNAVALGVLAAMTGEGLEPAGAAIAKEFAGKGREVIGKNLAAARAGFEHAAKQLKDCAYSLPKGTGGAPYLLSGNDAAALGAIAAGCKFYTAYPMSPATGIMNTVADYAARYGIIVEQAEDEIAAVNMAVGAGFAGIRAMTGTSGGGFALMCEGVSLAAMTETPLVVAVVMRPGPATGFPTRTEQGDLDFVLSAGHGEFARAVYAPGSPEEAFRVVKRAFNTAEKHQLPVLILSDQYLAESYVNTARPDLQAEAPDRGLLLGAESDPEAERYAHAPGGVSPRLIPGRSRALAVADSDEHGTAGHITELAEVRIRMTQKRLHAKAEALAGEVLAPTVYKPGSRVMLCGFGSTLGLLREAAGARADTGFVHYSQVWPFPAEATRSALGGSEKAATVENNASGQLARLIRRETGIGLAGSLLKYDGRPFNIDEVSAWLDKEGR
jgi:2-oxoglutarate ferredoxin oxidoreductase subunit alpha